MKICCYCIVYYIINIHIIYNFNFKDQKNYKNLDKRLVFINPFVQQHSQSIIFRMKCFIHTYINE